MKQKLSVIVPCYNEEKNISKFYNKLKEDLKDIDLELIFVNDGSKDKTKEELDKILKHKEFKIKVIHFSRNFGKESAMLAGLENVRKDSEYISIIDADLQQNPKYLLDMYKILNENADYDEVACFQKKRKEGILSFFKKTFYKIINTFSEVEFKNGVSDFRMFRRTVMDAILSIKEHNRFSKGIFSYIGFNIYYMPYEVEKRKEGKTSWNFFSLFSYALLGFKNFTNIFLSIIKSIA
ncbi:MAG: glycosyltransferase family 2 protein, partial [Clostridiales bacterium]|nr:glycosyltransferase family 2 protein [Clostridiales bacterium]